MTKMWRILEELPELLAVPARWHRTGARFEARCETAAVAEPRFDPDFICPHEAVCAHRIMPTKIATSGTGCQSVNCDHVRSGSDSALVDLNWVKLGHQIARAFGCEAKNADLGLPCTRQIAVLGDAALPVMLTIQTERESLLNVVAHLVATMKGGFILLAPTIRLVDENIQALLQTANAGFFDLETHLIQSANGTLKARKSGKELFAPFLSVLADGHQDGSRRAGGTGHQAVARNEFCKTGSFWTVTFDGGNPFPLPPTLGAEYLDHLLHHPSEPISAHDLEMAIRPEKARSRPKNSVQSHLDADAVRDYLRQLDKLRGQREEAAEDGDLAKAEKLDGDIGAIEAELKKNGQAADTGERSRGNVSKAVAVVLRRLRKGDAQEKAFAQHLDNFISLGYECCYNQPKGNRWA